MNKQNDKEIIEKGVFIERAEPLTKEGIFAMGLNDKEYFIFCEGKKQGIQSKQKDFSRILDEVFRKYLIVDGKLFTPKRVRELLGSIKQELKSRIEQNG